MLSSWNFCAVQLEFRPKMLLEFESHSIFQLELKFSHMSSIGGVEFIWNSPFRVNE